MATVKFKAITREVAKLLALGKELSDAEPIEAVYYPNRDWSIIWKDEAPAYKAAYKYRKLDIRVEYCPNVTGWALHLRQGA